MNTKAELIQWIKDFLMFLWICAAVVCGSSAIGEGDWFHVVIGIATIIGTAGYCIRYLTTYRPSNKEDEKKNKKEK